MSKGLLNQSVDNPLVSSGFIFMVLSAASFCMMTVFVKLAGETLPTIQIVFVRGLFTLALTWIFIYRKKIKPFGKHKKLLAARGLAGTVALFLVYESINRFPLSEATVIQYLYPLFTAVFAVLLLSEPITKNIIIGLCSGFFGVYCLLDFPIVSQNSIDIMSLILAVSGSILTGLAYVLVKKATNLNEHPLVVMFFFPLFTVPVFLPFIFSNWNTPSIKEWSYLILVGIFTQLGQLFLTYGYKELPATKAAPISYVQVLFATIIGIFFFDEIIDINFIIGSVIVLFSIKMVISNEFSKK